MQFEVGATLIIVFAVLALAVFLAIARGNYTVEGPFTLQAMEKRTVPAPFSGRSASWPARCATRSCTSR